MSREGGAVVFARNECLAKGRSSCNCCEEISSREGGRSSCNCCEEISSHEGGRSSCGCFCKGRLSCGCFCEEISSREGGGRVATVARKYLLAKREVELRLFLRGNIFSRGKVDS